MQAGTIKVGEDTFKLFAGVNVVGRESEDSARNHERIVAWTDEFRGVGPVSAVLVRGASISSKHAAISKLHCSLHVARVCQWLP